MGSQGGKGVVRGTVVPLPFLYTAALHFDLIRGAPKRTTRQTLVEKASIVVVLPAHVLGFGVLRLLQHFHASLA